LAEGDALHVAMSDCVHRSAEWVVGWDRPVRSDTQHLAVERVTIRGVRTVECVACADPQVPVRTEPQATAVVPVSGADAVEHHPVLTQRPQILTDAQRHDPVRR
jgi:hypothetical protein